ncbi:hypothetical protein J2803_006123 [Paraburkholderia phenoliruptrix]|nr:hypothetical protein [Paraburkholderia phenoliruptrix]
MIRRLDHFTSKHPILSMLIGWLMFIAIVVAAVPKDPDYVDAVVKRSAT